MPSHIGARMEHAVTVTGLTQREVAALSGTSESTLSRYINGRQTPGSGYLARFVEVTGADGHWLLTGQHIHPDRAGQRALRDVVDVLAASGLVTPTDDG